jgi:hypothetical protein
MKGWIKAASAACAATALVACGGGGGGGETAPPVTAQPLASGVYSGTLTGSAWRNFQLLVVPGGEYWAMYGNESGDTFAIAGFLRGTASVYEPGALQSSNFVDYGTSPPTLNGRVAAVNTAATVEGVLTYPVNQFVTFRGGRPTNTTYNFDAAPSIADVVGNWTLTRLPSGSATLTIGAGGGFTGTFVGTCAYIGAIAPHPSGKNLFEFSATLQPPCVATAYRGIAISNVLNTGRRQLIVAAPAGTASAFAAFGQR